MRSLLCGLVLLPLFVATPSSGADPFQPEPGFELLFDGTDLTGWNYRKKKQITERFDGQTATSDGRFTASDGMLVAHPHPEGEERRARLWTAADFPGDFELRLEFRASRRADSGLYLRKPQLQVRDYPEVGPYEGLTAYKSNDWNELVVVVEGTSARVTCNGEVLEEALELPANGPIGLESDAGTVEYRHIRLKPLP